MKKLLIAGVTCLLAIGCFFYISCVHYTEAYQAGITWNRITGELRLDTHAGIHITPPWVIASKVDTRPIRVCVTSAGQGFNCKLVQFEVGAWREFVAVQGFHYWWLANRISINMGYSDEYRGMKDLLRGYAYSTKQYSFIRTLREYPAP